MPKDKVLRSIKLSKVIVKYRTLGEFSLFIRSINFSVYKKNDRWHMVANFTKYFTKEEIAKGFNGYR